MIDDTELDTLLAAARPDVRHDPDCAACRQPVRPQRRWPRRLALAGAAGVTVVAVGAGAAATVGLPFVAPAAPVEHTQAVSTGDTCDATYRFVADGHHPEELAAAEAALAQLDIGSLDISDELAALVEEYQDATWEGPGPEPDYQYFLDSQDALEAQALSSAVREAVTAELGEQGLEPRFSLTTQWLCDDHELATR